MSANIQTYVGRQAAWHHMGLVTGKYQTSAELMAHSGFQFDVFKSQLRDGLGRPVDAWGTFRWNHADKERGDKHAAIFLSAVGKDYTCIHHFEGVATSDALVQSVDGGHYEAAGVLGIGETVWTLADLGLSFNIGDDEHKSYLLFVTGHDGSQAHTYALCDTRVVCQNTLRMALAEKGQRASIRHTKNAQSKLDSTRSMLLSARGSMLTLKERMEALVYRKVTRESMATVLDRLFPKVKDADGADRETTRRANIIGEILAAYESNDNNAFPEQRGTAYNLLNAITGYVDHSRLSDQSKRAESALFGSGNDLKSRALEVISQVSGEMPTVTRTVYSQAYSPVVNGSVLDDILDAA